MPSVLYTKNFGVFTSLEVNTSLLFEKSFGIGFSFRNRIEEETAFVQENGSGISQSIIRATMAYYMKKENNNFRVGYCYNFNSGKNGTKVGSHDLSLAYSIPNFK